MNLDDISRARENYLQYVAGVCHTGRAEVIAGRQTKFASRSPRDGALAFGASFLIDTYLQRYPRGLTLRPAPAFLLRSTPLTIRVPDVAFIATERLAQFKSEELWRVAPDLIVEVINDPARQSEVDGRINDFFEAGTQVAWILDALTDTCEVRRRSGESRTFANNDKVYSAPVLPRLNLYVYELFGD
jgi:Uma2 family endonuclease